MIKRLLILLTVFIIIAQNIAYADVIWAPEDNDFFDRHQKECEYVGRSYYVNGVNGFLSVKTAPNSNTEVKKMANGNIILIQFTCDYKGEKWGVTGSWENPSGWVPMSQLVLVYDYIAFSEEHENEFYNYEGDFNSLKNVKGEIILWTWPGSGEIKSIMDKNTADSYVEYIINRTDYEISQAYKDKQGREWLYISYWRGNRNLWICLSDPVNKDIPAFNQTQKPESIKSDGKDFLEQKISDTEQIDRRFYVNSPDGYLNPKEEPDSKKDVLIYEDRSISYTSDENAKMEVLTYNNGDIINISRTLLLNGKYWGAMSPRQSFPNSGWIPMEQLLLIYERQDFEEENKKNLYQYTGSYEAVFASKRHILWQWPGSDREKRIFDDERYVLKGVDTLYAYKDTEGREWGYVNLSYVYTLESVRVFTTITEGWLCLSDPANGSDIAAFNPAPKPTKWSPDSKYKWVHNAASEELTSKYSLSNIAKVKAYEQNKTFTDVKADVWYNDAIKSAYEYGIIEGVGNDEFNPDGMLLSVEAIIIASRIHAPYKYGNKKGAKLIEAYDASNKSWQEDGAVVYCKVEELISGTEFEYFKNITRAQMVRAWAKILQPEDMKKQNTVISLPDVNEDTPYFDDIILFYEAGIIGGVDAEGTFKPDGRITRAEASAIFMRLIDVNKREGYRTYENSN